MFRRLINLLLLALFLSAPPSVFSQGGHLTPAQESWLRQIYMNRTGLYDQAYINSSQWTNWFRSNSNTLTALIAKGVTNLVPILGSIDNAVVTGHTGYITFNTNYAGASVTNGLASISYVDAATNGLLSSDSTNGWIVSSHAGFLTTELDPIWTGVSNLYLFISSTNGWVVSSHAGFVDQTVTNGLLAASATNGWVVSSHAGFVDQTVTNGLASVGYVDAATNGLLTVSATNGWVVSSHAGFVDQTITNGILSAANTFTTNAITNISLLAASAFTNTAWSEGDTNSLSFTGQTIYASFKTNYTGSSTYTNLNTSLWSFDADSDLVPNTNATVTVDMWWKKEDGTGDLIPRSL